MDDKKIIKSNLKNKIHLGAWEKLNIARLIERPTSLDFIEEIFNDFIELHGDRHFADDKCIVGGIATLNSIPVTIVAQQRGRNTKENIERNFGMPQPEGYRKALRLMKQAEKFKRPVICFVDTKGAYCGIGAEERGQGEAIAKNLLEMSMLKTPIISIVIGEGGSGGALALALADEVWMLENSIYSTLSPEGFASILWKDSSRAKEAAEAMKVTAENLKEFGIIDKILKEPRGGAHKAPKVMAAAIKGELIKSLAQLTQKPLDNLVQDRYNKFRNMGRFVEK
ncbi:MAG: acetyl-CoA carboxylase subunit alpha [Clostridiaceae bacterium]|nr:acetyl-CoA carboxylase subunit alpha [Clostridiaceae bacterium]